MLSKLSALLTLSRRELLVLALVFAVSLPAVTARLYSSDEVQYFSERELGKSKMGLREIVGGATSLLKLRLQLLRS